MFYLFRQKKKKIAPLKQYNKLVRENGKPKENLTEMSTKYNNIQKFMI